MPHLPRLTALLGPLAFLGGCQLMGGEPAEAVAARKEAEGKAIGGACLHAGRAIEDYFALNRRADKAASAAKKASEPAHDDGTTKKPAKSKKRDT